MGREEVRCYWCISLGRQEVRCYWCISVGSQEVTSEVGERGGWRERRLEREEVGERGGWREGSSRVTTAGALDALVGCHRRSVALS